MTESFVDGEPEPVAAPRLEPTRLEAPSLEQLMENLDVLIRDAPEPTAEQLAAAERRQAEKERDHQIFMALGPHSGWPEKYLEAVKTPAHGDQWLAALHVASGVVERNGIVCLYGIRGSGKTRMAAELSVKAGMSRYRTAMRFFLEVRATYGQKGKSEIDIIDDLVATPLLILDEIQERGETAFEDRLLTHVIDARYAAMKPTILIANLKKDMLAESLGPSIVDRARENGKSIEFNWPSYRGTQP